MLGAGEWYLLGDIGGSNARFAAARDGAVEHLRILQVQDFPEFGHALDAFLADLAGEGGWHPFPQAACLAVAAPVNAEKISFTNSPWLIDRVALEAQLGGAHVALINDFEGIGHAVPALQDSDWVALGGGEPSDSEPIAVLGPGTGLGVCTVVPAGSAHRVLAGEGGHVDFAPNDERDIEVLRILWKRFGRVSAERLLCGDGLVQIYRALATLRGRDAPSGLLPAQVSEAALAGGDELADETLDLFMAALGAMAGNVALTVGARGGVYIAGGIAPRILPLLRKSRFRDRFLHKGRFRGYLDAIPTRVIVYEQPALLGCLRFLQAPVA